MTDSAGEQPVIRPLRLGWVGALAVLVFLVGGVVYLLVRIDSNPNPEIDALVPVREIRPFHVIEPHDLGVRKVQPEQGQTYLSKRAELEGRYALSTLSPDRPITPDGVGPVAPAGLNASFVFTIEGDAGVSLAGKLSRGDSVEVIALGQASRIEDAFVLDVRNSSAGRWAVTLASRQELSPEQAAILTEDRVNVVRRPES